MNSLLGEHQLTHTSIIKSHQCVSEHGKFVESSLSLITPALSFESEWHSGKYDNERTLFTRNTANEWCGT